MYASNPSTWEAEAGGSLKLVWSTEQVSGQQGLHSETKTLKMIILPVVPNHSMQCYVLVAAGSPACGESSVQYMPGSRDALKEHV